MSAMMKPVESALLYMDISARYVAWTSKRHTERLGMVSFMCIISSPYLKLARNINLTLLKTLCQYVPTVMPCCIEAQRVKC